MALAGTQNRLCLAKSIRTEDTQCHCCSPSRYGLCQLHAGTQGCISDVCAQVVRCMQRSAKLSHAAKPSIWCKTKGAEMASPRHVLSLQNRLCGPVQGGLSARPLLSVPHILADEASCYYHGYVLAEMSVHQVRAIMCTCVCHHVHICSVHQVLAAGHAEAAQRQLRGCPLGPFRSQEAELLPLVIKVDPKCILEPCIKDMPCCSPPCVHALMVCHGVNDQTTVQLYTS